MLPRLSLARGNRIGAVIVLGALLAGLGTAEAARRWAGRAGPRRDGPPGNLAITDVKIFDVSTTGGAHRLLARVLVENQSPIDRIEPWQVRLTVPSKEQVVGRCGGESLPRGQVAACEIWLTLPSPLAEGAPLRAEIDPEHAGFAEWDGDPGNDVRSVDVRTFPADGSPVRVAEWDVQPRIVHGTGEVQFRFTVEDGHLVWLLVEDQAPRLLAGHPADGIVSGRGSVRIKKSGPVTVIARNSLGAFVYEAIPVLNSYQRATPRWVRLAAESVDDVAKARILEPGVYEIDDDGSVLEHLSQHLAGKDWGAALEKLRQLDQFKEKPAPASVLNPEGLRDR
ncbi:MAG: hypothetical protein JSV80_17630 [Acidobacteriota bacterium]|nr:MAG: hypothetical protein JSV80_17630 [Acidobacteriota bacterium]